MVIDVLLNAAESNLSGKENTSLRMIYLCGHSIDAIEFFVDYLQVRFGSETMKVIHQTESFSAGNFVEANILTVHANHNVKDVLRS